MIIKNQGDVFNKIFWLTTIPFGIATGLLVGLKEGIEAGVLIGLGAGLLFGILMSLVLGGLHYFSTRHLGVQFKEAVFGVHQVEVLTLDEPYESALETCAGALLAIPGCEVTRREDKQGLVFGQVKMSWKSFGEQILAAVSAEGPDRSRVTLSSKPLMPTTLVDYGKSIENMRALVGALNKSGKVIDARSKKSAALPDSQSAERENS